MNGSEGKPTQSQPTLEEIVNTPLPEDEARLQLADLDIQLAECQREVAAAEARRMDLMWMRAVVLRRTLNPTAKKPEPGPTDGSGN